MSNLADQDFVVLAQPDGLADNDGTAWNVQLTRLLRNTERYAWGNWTLDPTIEVGALGWFNPTDGHFQSAQSVIKAPAVTNLAAVDWHLEQGHVKQTSVGVGFKVPYKDPTTGTEVNLGMESKWEFGSKGSLTSQGSAYGTASVQEPAQFMLDNYEAILKVAKANGKAIGNDIAQGFGMITKVWMTDGCVNIGSRQDKAEFSITGSVDGVAAMTGSDQSASLKGSYKHASTSDHIEKRIFPSKADEVDSTPVAYAYEFTSFAGKGKVIIPRYVGDISALNLSLSNSGSYIVDARVTFDTDREKGNHREVRVSGGMTGQVTGLPLDATNIDIRMDFMLGATQFLRVSNPLNTWYLGRGQIELTGWWPGASGTEWR